MIVELVEEVYEAVLGQANHTGFVILLVLDDVDESIQCATVDESLPSCVPAFLLQLFQLAKTEHSRQ